MTTRMSFIWPVLWLIVILGGVGSLLNRPRLYNEKPLGSGQNLSPREKRIVEFVTDRLSKTEHGEARPDPVANTVCKMLASTIEPSGAEFGVEMEYIAFTLLRYGITDAFYFPLIVKLPQSGAIEEVLRPDFFAYAQHSGLNRFGLSYNRRNSVLALVFFRRLVKLKPFPVEVSPGSTHILSGELCSSCSNPALYVGMPDSTAIFVSYPGNDREFSSKIYFPDIPGKYMLEIVVWTRYGPQVANLFPVYAGVPPPERPVVKLYPQIDEEASEDRLEKQLFFLINREREKQGLPHLLWDAELAARAKQHSRLMAESGRLVHSLPNSPPLTAGELENISLNTSLAFAHSSLMQSPSHKRNILSNEITSCGIGITAVPLGTHKRLLYITERFK